MGWGSTFSNMTDQDILYVVFDDERVFVQEPGRVVYLRSPSEWKAYIATEPYIDVLILDHDLGIDWDKGHVLDVRDSILEYVGMIEVGAMEPPGCVWVVTGNPSGGYWLVDQFSHLTATYRDPFGSDIGLTTPMRSTTYR